MKGVFKDGKDWKIGIVGDWSGGKSGYSEKKAEKIVYFSGAMGLWHYMQGDFQIAVDLWQQELAIVMNMEHKEQRRVHKGWYYYMIGMAYRNLKRDVEASENFSLADVEDTLSYGKNAKTFPAAKLKKGEL